MANPFSKFIGPDKTEYEVKDKAARQAVEDIKNPEFDDSGAVEGITSFPAFLEKYVSKMDMLQFLRDMRAGFNFVLHGGHIINNCVTDRADLPGSAAQLKVLMDLYNQLNGSLTTKLAVELVSIDIAEAQGSQTISIPDYDSYNALVMICFTNLFYGGVTLYIPKPMYGMGIPFFCDNSSGDAAYNFVIQGYVVHGNAIFYTVNISGWNNVSVRIYGLK